MSIHAAEAEAADGRPAQRHLRRSHGSGCSQHAERAIRVAQAVRLAGEVRLRRQRPRLHGQQDLGDRRCAGAGQQMADSRLHRTDRAPARLPARFAPQFSKAVELDGVADGVPVAWHSIRSTSLRLPAGAFVGRPHRPELPFLRRSEQVAVHVVR